MRYYLDTNILVFLLFDKNLKENLSREVLTILSDYGNLFFASSIAIRELVYLYNSSYYKTNKYKNTDEIFNAIDAMRIEIKPFTQHHVKAYSSMTFAANHKDPNDHMIIAQAISDKIQLISSDTEFQFYEEQKLKFIFNKR